MFDMVFFFEWLIVWSGDNRGFRVKSPRFEFCHFYKLVVQTQANHRFVKPQSLHL